jgi:CDP-diacylglycerol---serine O-phosphatidyltransferase
MSNPRPRKAMIFELHLADWFTLANAACGTGALFSAVTYLGSNAVEHVHRATALIVAALVFDILDGRIARWRRKNSLMGRELDSLADVISFGVAPAMLAYVCGMQGTFDKIVLCYFVACGVSRLARFNVTADALSEGADKVRYFEGTPIPTSVVLVALVAIAATVGAVHDRLWLGQVSLGDFELHPLVLLFALSGTLMISRLRIPKL